MEDRQKVGLPPALESPALIKPNGSAVLAEKMAVSPERVTRVDTGLGTTYERWALNRWLLRFFAHSGVRSAAEGPDDGMTGIAGLNSLILGLHDVNVSLVLPHAGRAAFARQVWGHYAPGAPFDIIEHYDGERLPFADRSVDLAWNFNVLTRHPDPLALVTEMARITRKYVLVFVPNRQNYAFWLHRLHHRVAQQPWDHGRVDLMHPKVLQSLFAQTGLRFREIIWLDCPWWPDIVDFGQLISDFFPLLKGFSQRARPENRLIWTADALPYYCPEEHPDVHDRMNRLAFFENSRWEWLRRRFAHHVGLLGEHP